MCRRSPHMDYHLGKKEAQPGEIIQVIIHITHTYLSESCGGKERFLKIAEYVRNVPAGCLTGCIATRPMG